MTDHIKHYNLQIHNQPDTGEKTKGRRYIPSPEKLRERAMEEYEEARNKASARCYVCHYSFLLDYMRFVKVGTWENDWVCSYCQMIHHFVIAR